MHPALSSNTRLTLWLLLWLLASPQLKAEQALLLSSINNYQPYSYEQDGQIKGLYNDIAREAFQRAQVPLRIELISFQSVLRKIRIGFSHAMIGAFHTPERETYAHYLATPQTSISTSLFVHIGSQIDSTHLTQLNGKIIGIKQGFIMEDSFEEAVAQGRITRYEVETERQLVLMLLNRRIDGFIHTTGHSLFYIDQHDKHNEIALLAPPIVNRRPSFLAFSRIALKTLPATLMPRIEEALKGMRLDGTLAALHTKYSLPYTMPSPSLPLPPPLSSID